MPQSPWTAGPAPADAWTAGAAPADAWSDGARPPDFKTTNATDEQGNPLVDGASKIWQAANSPLLPQIAEAAHAIEEFMSRPNMGDQTLNDAIPSLQLGTEAAKIRGLGAGMIGGIGDVATSMTSPIGLALTLAGLGEGGLVARNVPRLKPLLQLPAVQALQRAVQVGAGAGFTGHGAQEVVMNPTLAGKARGVAEMAGGALGVASGLPRRAPATPAQAAAADANARAVEWATKEGIPVDAGTATGNRWLKLSQDVVDRTLGGSIATRNVHRTLTDALETKGAELADRARPNAISADEAGQGSRDALASKAEAHGALADHRYDGVRAAEADPVNQVSIPLPKTAPVDALPTHLAAQLRRITHEMDASGYQSGKLVRDSLDTSDSHYTRRTGGAAVFHDITAELGYEPTRAAVQAELEAYLGGTGKETATVKAALKVAEQRHIQKDGGTSPVSRPELDHSYMREPTRLEKTRVTSEQIGLPVDLEPVQKPLEKLAAQLERQMSPFKQQNHDGLNAIRAILKADRYAPLSQIDRDLSAIKKIARQGGDSAPLAKFAAKVLDDAVMKAAANGGPEVVRLLKEGRAAHKSQVITQDLIDLLPGGPMKENVAIVRRATAAGDSGLSFLRTLQKQTPQAIPQVARAFLDDLLTMKTDAMQSAWAKRGAKTKAVLFPEKGQIEALDHFFRVQHLLQKSLNPSQSGVYAARVAELGAMAVTNPIQVLAGEVGAAGVSTLLHSPAGVRALTKLLGTELQAAKAPQASPARLRTAARAASWAEVVAAARAVGVPLQAPALATSDRPEQP